MSKPFIVLEDEIEFRRMLRNTYKHEGMIGILQCVGEMGTCIRIALELAKELTEEEK